MSEVLRPIFADKTESETRNPYLRPRDAATLILVDAKPGAPLSILMGRRKSSLRFMPGLYVFPGGRVDGADGRMDHRGSLSAQTIAKHSLHGPRAGEARLKAICLCAVRETYEEAGVLLGRRAKPARIPNPDWQAFDTHGVTPDIDDLVFFCRAITPPGRPRRFDTRFFLAERQAVAVTLPEDQRPDTDLEATEWLSLEAARAKPLPFITRLILDDVEKRLAMPDWRHPSQPTTYYFNRGNKQLRHIG